MRSILLSLLLVLPFTAYLQSLRFKLYTEKDGLNSTSVYDVVRDGRGLLWIGTPFGINWFDGTHFFQPSVPRKVDQLYVQRFYKDNEGSVWILTFYNGFYKFQNGHFKQYLIDTSYSDINQNNILDMVEVAPGYYSVATDRGVYFFDGNRFQRLDPKNLNGQIETVNFFSGHLLVGFGGGLYCYRNDNGWKLVSRTMTGISVNKVFNHQGHLWIATDKGLSYFEHFDPEKTNQPTITYLKNEVISDVVADDHNDVWFAGGASCYKVSGDKFIEYKAVAGLKTAVTHIYFDHQNIGWLSTNNGLYKLGEGYSSFRKMSDGPISFVKTNSRIWMSFRNGISDLAGKDIYHFPNDAKALFTNLYYASKARQVWVANDDGVFVLKNNRLERRFSLNCSYLYEDDQGSIWMATRDGRLFTLVKEQLQPIKFECFQNDFVSTIFRDDNGFVWLGFRTGGVTKCRLEGFNLRKVKEFSAKTGFTDLRIRSCCSDKKGNVLFGTRTNGLFVFSVSNGQLWHVNSSNGLKATWIQGISTSDTSIYLATNGGLFMMKQKTSYEHPELTAISFSDDDISNQMNCVLVDGGQVWIGSNGLTCFLPAKFKRDTSPCPVFITQVNINGKTDGTWVPYSSQQNVLHLPHNDNVIAFEFAGIHLKDQDELLYRYKLEGQDNDWSLPTDRNFVSYNLPPGKYRFVVEAQNALGVWSNRPAFYSFVIAQPFWTSWWFVSLDILLALGIVYLIYQYRLRQAMKFEQLRYKISTDLHDDIGSTLSSISILSDLTLTEKNGQQNAAMVSEIKENSLSLMEKMDDIVWSINPKNDSLGSLLLRIKRFSSRLFEAKDIEYSIDIDKAVDEIKLPMEYRQHVYLIMKEAINNLVKYSGATHAAVEINFINSMLKIRVTDNGKGFDLKTCNHGNGILNMKSRADLMKANLKIESCAGEGTTIRLQVKIK